MSKGQRLNKTGTRCALVALAVISGLVEPRSIGAMEWKPMEHGPKKSRKSEHFEPKVKTNAPLKWTSVDASEETTKEQKGVTWTAVSGTDRTDPEPPGDAIVWEQTEPSEVITADEIELDKTLVDVLITNEPSGPTHASRRTLWRDDEWLPQITSIIPNGFGPAGLMLELSATGTDCTLGKGPCEPFSSFADWQDSLSSQANGEIYGTIGFGNSQKGLGSLLITNSFERVAADVRNSTVSQSPLQGLQTGLHISRALGPDTSLRTGVENLITWDAKDYTYADMTRNFYAVASQRLRLKTERDTNPWLKNLYITGGVGNGEFKPIEKTFQDQTKALKDAGCATYGYEPTNPCSFERFKRALRTGSDYGNLHPIGALAVEMYPGFHLITEWTGRNLNAGFSFKPFPDLGLVITPMLNSLARNCEYPGCKVVPISGYSERVELPDVVYTERARLSIQATLNIKF